MADNYLLKYSEQLATGVEQLCRRIKAPSNTIFQLRKVQVAFMQTFERLTTVRAGQICFQSSK